MKLGMIQTSAEAQGKPSGLYQCATDGLNIYVVTDNGSYYCLPRTTFAIIKRTFEEEKKPLDTQDLVTLATKYSIDDVLRLREKGLI